MLEKLGTLLNHTLRACLEPVRSVAYSMNMTMPAPEEIAAQAKQPEPSAAPAVEAALSRRTLQKRPCASMVILSPSATVKLRMKSTSPFRTRTTPRCWNWLKQNSL
ncbi:hypothetical protein NIA69_22655 [Gemmiger formicilis]|nr:hypothetical protein [Gemmiger formicilis]